MGTRFRMALALWCLLSHNRFVYGAEEFEGFDLSTDSVLRAIDLSAYLIANFDVDKWGAGIGGQFAYPLLDEGLIPGMRFRDAIHLESGLDLLYWDWERIISDERYAWSAFAVVPQTGVRWHVYLVDSVRCVCDCQIRFKHRFYERR